MGAGLTLLGVSGPANAAGPGGAYDTPLNTPGLIDVNCYQFKPGDGPNISRVHLTEGGAVRTDVFNGPSSWRVVYTAALEPSYFPAVFEEPIKTFSSEADYNAFMNDVQGDPVKICSNMVGWEYGEKA
jgi:hypothetical protein